MSARAASCEGESKGVGGLAMVVPSKALVPIGSDAPGQIFGVEGSGSLTSPVVLSTMSAAVTPCAPTSGATRLISALVLQVSRSVDRDQGDDAPDGHCVDH